MVTKTREIKPTEFLFFGRPNVVKRCLLKCSCVCFVCCDFDLYGLTWRHIYVCTWIWFPRRYELQFFFKCLEGFLSTQSAKYDCFKSSLSNVDCFSWSTMRLPSYHKFHIWLAYGCQERFMVVNPGKIQF